MLVVDRSQPLDTQATILDRRKGILGGYALVFDNAPGLGYRWGKRTVFGVKHGSLPFIFLDHGPFLPIGETVSLKRDGRGVLITATLGAMVTLLGLDMLGRVEAGEMGWSVGPDDRWWKDRGHTKLDGDYLLEFMIGHVTLTDRPASFAWRGLK
jgi:hypothetical protein